MIPHEQRSQGPSPSQPPAEPVTPSQSQSQSKTQTRFSRCPKCNPTPAEKQERKSLQRKKIMCFYTYSNQRVTGEMLTGSEFRDMLQAGDSNYAKLDPLQCKQWVALEFLLFKFYVKYAIAENRKLHACNPFAQHQHDAVTLANHKKYFANGVQFCFGWMNWTICLGFRPFPGATAALVADGIHQLWEELSFLPGDFVGNIQDFADLAVSRELNFEKEGCLMHNEDKPGRFAVGVLTKSKNKNEVEAFPQGVALLAAMRDIGKYFKYGKHKELVAACGMVKCLVFRITLDKNKTRIAAVRCMLEPILRMFPGLKAHRESHPGVQEVNVTDQMYLEAAEFEGILYKTKQITTLVQHEVACSGGYKLPLYEMISDNLNKDLGFIDVIDIANTPDDGKAKRVSKSRANLSATGKVCFDRATKETKARHEMEGARPTRRDRLATGLDLRLIGRPGQLSETTMAKITRDVREKYEEYSAAFGDLEGPERPSQPQFVGGIPVLSAPTPNLTAKYATFDVAWANWLNLSEGIVWTKQFAEELKDKGMDGEPLAEDDLDAIHHLLELPVITGLYKPLIKDDGTGLHNPSLYGFLPQLALCYIGNNLASSYCERVNSCAKLIMTHDRTVLDDAHLEMICVLRMNKKFMYSMKHMYPELGGEWIQQQLEVLQ